jgi:hypothetical protein
MAGTLRAGTKVVGDGSGVEVILVRVPADSSVEVRPAGAAGPGAALGKRYTCGHCGAEVLVTKGGQAELRCHDAAMERKGPTLLPASD